MNILEELKKSYESCYVQIVQPDNTRIPVYLSEIDAHTGKITGAEVRTKPDARGKDKYYWHPIVYDIYEINIDFSLPPLGYVNIPSGEKGIAVAYLFLHPERQWKKGLNLKTLAVEGALSVSYSSAEAVFAIFNPKYEMPLESAHPTLAPTIAITKKLAVSYNHGTSREESLFVFFSGCKNAVGYVEEGTVFLYKASSHLQHYISKHLPCEVEK